MITASEVLTRLEDIDAKRAEALDALRSRRIELMKEVAEIDRVLGTDGDSKATASKASKRRGPHDNSAAAKIREYVTSEACTTEFNAEHVSAQLGIERNTVSAGLSRLAKKGVITATDKRGEYRRVGK